MSTSLKDKIVQFGLTEVYSSPDPQVDVVFVHGLNGHPYNTWATHKPDVFWPADLLPQNVEDQHCRILTYGYDANVTAFTDGASKDHIHNHAEHLAARLVANRSVKARERPIIFVAHSLGGLVVKRLLIYCESINNPKLERLRSIYVSTFGILFLGTPHNGSDLAKWGSLLQSICSVVLPKRFLDSAPQLVDALKTNNETLQNINRGFIEILDPFRIYFFHESKPMNFKGTLQFVVDEDSAAPVIQGVERMGIEKDHSHMCKFEDVSAPGYDVVADAISSYAEEAPAKVKGRWEREKRVREYHRQSIASELLGDNILNLTQPQAASSSARESQKTSMESSVQSAKQLETSSSSSSRQTPRVAPMLFRPNSVFVGFDIELARLERKLAAEDKKSIGTCSALICGPPGAGKSHLAREYVWTHQTDYPAGIFWVDCKTKENTTRYYWDIGQALGCLDDDRSGAFQTDDSFIEEVRKKLESLRGWLIVFDGIFFHSDEALSNFVKYIPDSPGNCIIYTSVDQTLKRRHRLLYPSTIKLLPLRPEAACDLLFKAMGMHKHTHAQKVKADALVRYYGCLPLGIHAAAHMLRAQGKALEKFTPATSDQRLLHPFLEILRALQRRELKEALTLLALLSLLDHKVPVGLLIFGAPSLAEFGLEIRSVDRGGGMKRELDNTISTLLKYGLVERELQTYSVSTENSRGSPAVSRTNTTTQLSYTSPMMTPVASLDTEESNGLGFMVSEEVKDSSGSTTSISITIDALRTHTVTQNVVRNEIRAHGLGNIPYHHWLTIACHFLCSSYAVANSKLRSFPGQGSVADYREYLAQFSTLRTFLPRSHEDVPNSLKRVKKEVLSHIRDIKDEIRNRSPSQSQSSYDAHQKILGSIFDNIASSPDEGPFTPNSDITRMSTWSSDRAGGDTESPTYFRFPRHANPEDVFSAVDDDGYSADLGDLTSTIRSSQQWGVTSQDTSRQPRAEGDSPRQSFLHALMPGQAGGRRDLGEFKLMPTVGRISNPEILTSRPRSRSSSSSKLPWPFRRSSAESSAEASLAAVQARSPLIGPRALPESRKASSSSESRERPRLDTSRQPLSERSTNTSLPLIAADTENLPPDMQSKPRQGSFQHSRTTSTSPRLVNAVLTRQAAISWEGLPVEENITITRRFPASTSNSPPTIQSDSFGVFDSIPAGYMSVPMSRNVSRESRHSLVSAPAEPIQLSSSLTPDFVESYDYQRRALPSIDVALTRSLDLGHSGGWTTLSPAGFEDDLGGELDLTGSASKTAPVTPNLGSRHSSRDETMAVSVSKNRGNMDNLA